MRLNDLTGKVIGRLLVVTRAEDHVQANGRRRTMWNCLCSCGSSLTIEAGNLSTGHTQSCGCLTQDTCAEIGARNATHRRTKTREWFAWRGAKDRCTNPNTPSFKNYGARGIAVCPQWVNSFETFLKDMGKCPAGLTLDRINVDEGYSPDNCRWASHKEQARNRRMTVRVVYLGREVPLADVAELHGLDHRLVYDRYKRQGWNLTKAITTPPRSASV